MINFTVYSADCVGSSGNCLYPNKMIVADKESFIKATKMTDIARYKSDEPKDVIKNWMRSKDTIEFLGLWEKLHNSNFKGVEFDPVKRIKNPAPVLPTPERDMGY